MNEKVINNHKEQRFAQDKLNVFISYSHDDELHKEWVRSIAEKIREIGCNPLIDQEFLKPGMHINLKMETMIVRSDVVLIILTPRYKQKADNRINGVGYEYHLINNELVKSHKNEKYIPILRKGNIDLSVPTYLKGFMWSDLRDKNGYEEKLDELLEMLRSSEMKHPENKTNNKVEAEIELIPDQQFASAIREKFNEYFDVIFKVNTVSKMSEELPSVPE
ncbi:MAG: toll/interleukin-1 receptor domain-containing protein, partial [Cyclobacteriaceae bacterium]